MIVNSDAAALIEWINICLIVAAVCTTAFPIMYAFSRWEKYLLGRLLMLQAVTFAVAIDLTLLFTFWVPKNILVALWINAAVLGLIAVSSAALTWKMWQLNHPRRKEQLEDEQRLHLGEPGGGTGRRDPAADRSNASE